jgi:hypothetical protein
MEGQEAGRRFRAVPLLCASLAVVLGVMTFTGWISGFPLPASVRAKYIPMAPSTALCFSLLGAGPSGQVFSQEQLRAAVNRHADRSPEEFFTRLLQDIHRFSKRDSFDDDVCIVGVEVRHTEGPIS